MLFLVCFIFYFTFVLLRENHRHHPSTHIWI
nr:MAG TPA: hypothetical protein [Caudoviricetes sp.]DAW86885.1 MAG TPA: hypothetical protein [Bacteriophage sp.]